MSKKHGDWLRVDWESRQAVKQEYGVFAGKEQSLFPDTKRRSGIPSLIVVGGDGKELDILDCDSPTVIKAIQSKGVGFLEQWKAHAW